METTFHLNADELNASFLEGLRKLFAGQNIVISVAPELDTTAYLLSDETRKAQLLQSMQEAESGQLVAVNLDELRQA